MTLTSLYVYLGRAYASQMPYRPLLLALFLAACSSPCGARSQASSTSPAAEGAEPTSEVDPSGSGDASATRSDGTSSPLDLRTVEGFWNAFRQATLSNDVSAVAALTGFPLVTRGSMDDCPEVEHSRDNFENLWPQLLQTEPGLGHNENMRGLIQRLSTVPENELRHVEQSGGIHLRMGDFEFRRSDRSEEFRFSYAYWSADNC